jgi:peptidoglycan/LPS O-acetylase OafA/YrhL
MSVIAETQGKELSSVPIPRAGQKAIPSLDGTRAISILIVFLSHVGFSAVVPGGFGLAIFFSFLAI